MYLVTAVLPTPQPGQIADQVAECVEQGASIAALHARRPGDDALLCRGHTRWRTGAALRTMRLPEASGAALHQDLTVTASCCPVTSALLGVDVHLVGTQPAHDLDLDLSPGGIADQLTTP